MSDNINFSILSNAVPITGVQFGLMGGDEIKDNSCLKSNDVGIVLPESYENGYPKRDGLADTRMGTIDNNQLCSTCGKDMNNCEGHFGHIKLADAVFNNCFLIHLKKIMECICINCSKLRFNPLLEDYESIISNNIGLKRIDKLRNKIKNLSVCKLENNGCGMPFPSIKIEEHKNAIIAEFKTTGSSDTTIGFSETSDQKNKIIEWLTPIKCYHILSKISDEDCSILGINSKYCRPESMIITYLPVSPPATRPSVKADSMFMEDDCTHIYADIIKQNIKLSQYTKKENTDLNPLHSTLRNYKLILQVRCNTLMNNDAAGPMRAIHRNGKSLKSFSTRLKGKEGRLRGNLMGKRVNYSSRSVITPDPNLEVDQLGVPLSIAMNLSVPEVVTPYNIEEMRAAVLNGKYKYPGANFVYPESALIGENSKIDVKDLRYASNKIDLRYGDIVMRHLKDNDIVLFNRQPTLHKMSMMGHRVVIFKDCPDLLTFRINLCVTGAYNADFDGDEMNMHVPQNIPAETELKMLACVPNQVVSAALSKPAISPIQDTLIGGYLMTFQDIELNRWEIQKLLIHCGLENIDISKIQIPKKVYGRDILSIIIPKLVNKYKIKNGNVEINIENGKILKGILEKSLLKSGSGLIHQIWLNYGQKAAINFMNKIQKITNEYLLMRGFTASLEDIFISKDTQSDIKKMIEADKKEVDYIISEVEENIDNTDEESLEKILLNLLNTLRSKASSIVNKNYKDDNNIKVMLLSGSKGNANNISQLSGCVGQQNITGKRVPKIFNGRTLPQFFQNDDSANARGFVSNSYFEGLTAAEFFFHGMGGREGLIDTAIKTSDTGYVQRKLIKALEDLKVCYDGTVRDSIGNIMQFVYGDTGINPIYQIKQKLHILELSYKEVKNKYFFTKEELIKIKTKYSLKDDALLYKNVEYYKQILMDMYIKSNMGQHFLEDVFYVPFSIRNLFKKYKPSKKPVDPQIVYKFLIKLNSIVNTHSLRGDNDTTNEINAHSKLLYNSLIATELSPKMCSFIKKISESDFNEISEIIVNNLITIIVEPGEMIGIIAAQSIGEPTTQMTLNTFHQAGIKSTAQMGVARVVEVLSISKKQKTPEMYIVIDKDSKLAKNISENLSYLTIKDIVNKMDVYYSPIKELFEADNINISNKNKILCEKDHMRLEWLFRLELNKDILYKKNIQLMDIIYIYCNYWSSRIKEIQGYTKKESKEIFRGILNTTILSNDDNSNVPTLYIMVSFNSDVLDYQTFIDFDKNVLEKIQLTGYRGITDAILYNDDKYISFNKDGKPEYNNLDIITTNGDNLIDIREIRDINLYDTESNNILDIYLLFGIEAARTIIIKELYLTIRGAGADVNYQHISLLADFMTHNGVLTSINRHGINKLNVGVLARSSFEETLDLLLNASVFCERDNIRSVSSNIIMGKTPPVGTGTFDILIDFEKITNVEFNKEYDVDSLNEIEADVVMKELLNTHDKHIII